MVLLDSFEEEFLCLFLFAFKCIIPGKVSIIGAPISWKKALKAIYDSKGLAETVTDSEILEAQRTLARQEGLFIEPASASSIAGLKKMMVLMNTMT